MERLLPWHPAWPHEQSTSGVFSIASQSLLQYLPDVVGHEQTGCAHFSAFAEAISFLLSSDQEGTTQAAILVSNCECFCTEMNTREIALMQP